MKSETSAVLRLLRAGVPGEHPEITDDVLDAWDRSLSRFPARLVVDAAAAWVEQQPRFPALSDFIAHVQRTARESSQRAIQSGERATLKCPECEDGSGMLLLNADGQGTYRPCSRCRLDGFKRWEAGHYADGHDCPECGEVRKTHLMPARGA